MNSRIPWSLEAGKGIIGPGPRWHATATDAWLDLIGGAAFSGRWIELVWSQGLWEPPSRPILRCTTPSGDKHMILPGAVLGRGRWMGRIPPDTTAIRIAPVDRIGTFGFRIDVLRALPLITAIGIGLARKPKNATTALLAASVGLKVAAGRELADALVGTPLSGFASWRAAHERDADPAVDGDVPTDAANVRLVLLASRTEAAQLQGFIDASHGSNWRIESIDDTASVDTPSAAQCGNDTPLADVIETLGDNDLVIPVPADVRLEPRALTHLAIAAGRSAEADWFFGDEVAIAPTGPEPRFRQQFDDLLAERLDYFGAVVAYRVRTLRRAGADGLSCGALLRLGIAGDRRSLTAGKGRHIPRLLATVPAAVERHRPRPPVPAAQPTARDARKISIIIPTRDRLDLLRTCIDSIEHADPAEIEIVVVDNGSVKAETKAYLAELGARDRFVVVDRPIPFNYSRLCNDGAAQATGDLLVFLNNDTAFDEPDWLAAMATHAVMSEVGAVGLKLLYPNGRLQHGGVVLGSGGRAGHLEIGAAGDDPGYFGRLGLTRRIAAITGACLMVERRKFEAIGGFDAENLPIDLNDIDLCLRLAERGLCNVYVGEIAGIHNESASRGRLFEPDLAYASERRFFERRWLHRLGSDPYFHPALSLATPRIELG